MTIGERIINLERMILNREGITRADDSLPVRMQEPVPTGPAANHAISASMLEGMLDEYYEERGWDGQGVPRPETIERLNLAQWVISA